MKRRTRDEIRDDKRPKNVTEFIQRNKYLRDEKYYKNNYWSWADWQSWAAQGKAGGCGCCGVGHYNAHLCNKRSAMYSHKRENHCKHVSSNLCSQCANEITKQIGIEFTRH